MNKDDPNVVRVELVARALGDAWEDFVLVGGCAAGLLITDQASPPVRATEDVDLVAEITSLAEYYVVRERLVALGFVESGDITCRWRRGSLIVDVMPTDERVLGYSNRWYGPAVKSAVTTALPSGARIKLVASPLFIATKLEAFHGRGNGRYNDSHDIEDIINVMNGRAELPSEVRSSPPEIRDYLSEEIEQLLLSTEFLEAIPWHLSADAASQARRDVIISRLRTAAGL